MELLPGTTQAGASPVSQLAFYGIMADYEALLGECEPFRRFEDDCA